MNTRFPFETLETLRAAMDDPNVDRNELIDRLSAFGLNQIRRDTKPQVEALLTAGWTFVLPEGTPDPEPYQWQWRRPGKRVGRPGRLFRSTGQAYRAMMSETGAA